MVRQVRCGNLRRVTQPLPPMDEILATFAADTLIDRMGIAFVEMAPERVVATMPVAGNTQVAGVLHGGASCVLAETLGSVGAFLHVWPGGIALGTDINATHHRSTRSGIVTGVATAISLGRTLCSHEVVISDEEGRRLCTARITNYVRKAGS
jgi:uncharacterized protein (TIGR00369 family)